MRKLGFDRGLVDDRPDAPDFPVFIFVDHILAERDSQAIDIQIKEPADGRAIEVQATRNGRRIRDQKLNVEPHIGNVPIIAFQHRPIADQADPLAIIIDIPIDEISETVEAGDVASVCRGEISVGQ